MPLAIFRTPSRSSCRVQTVQIVVRTLTACLALCGVFAAAPPSAAAQAVTPAGNWVQATPANSPSARYFSTMAYDAATGTAVLFGGYGPGNTVLSDTWTWNGITWTRQSPATVPPARYDATMAYDSATGTVVLFGGYGTSSFLNDTWTWDGTNWTQQLPASSPSGRTFASMAYDAATSTVVLFGGNASGGISGDTWTWNGVNWTHQSPATSPSARSQSTMAYTPDASAVVLFGGTSSNVSVADTWTWNGTTWTQQSPAASPSARSNATSAYDTATGSLLLVAGSPSGFSSSYLRDTWTWNGTTWAMQSPAQSPSVRVGSTMAYDNATGAVVLFGGLDGVALADTWNYAVSPYFGSVAIGASSSATTTFNVTTAGTLGTPVVLTQGAPNLDFTLNTSGTTCTGAVAVGTCTVVVNFTPLYPGQRMGAVEVVDGSGNVLASIALQGSGSGPLLTAGPGTITTVAGTGTACTTSASTGCLDGGQAPSAQLAYPYSMAMDGTGNLFIADWGDHRIRKIAAQTGIMTTIAGTGTRCTTSSSTGCLDGGPAASAQLSYPYDVAVDGAGNLYIADENDQRVRKIAAKTGIITTVAGNGTACSTSSTTGCLDGSLATSATLWNPSGVAVDGAGNLYIGDYGNQRVRKVSAATGIITTVAGTGTVCSTATASCGDGGLATSAQLGNPYRVAVDGSGNLYISDLANQRIRKVTAATGIITTVAGTGTRCTGAYATAGCGDGGLATSAELYNPFSVAVDAAGNLYIADEADQRVREVNAVTGVITTVAGTGTVCTTSATTGCLDAGPATSAQLWAPTGVSLDAAGNIYIADQADNRIRKVTAAAATLAFASTALGSTSANQSVTINNIGNAALFLPIPSTGQNPSLSGGFTQSNSSTCPLVYSSSSSAGTLASGASCTEILSYTPAIAGSVTGKLLFTDNDPTGSQFLHLTGSTGPNLTVTVPNQSISSSATATLQFTVGYGGNTAPTATPVLTVNGSSTGVGTVSCIAKAGHNVCTATYSASTLPAGNYTFTATAPADATYTTATSGTGTLTITP